MSEINFGHGVKIGSFVISHNEADNDGLEKQGAFHIKSNAGVSGNVCIHEGTEPIASVSGVGHRLWVDTSHNLKWQDESGVSVTIGKIYVDADAVSAVENEATLQFQQPTTISTKSGAGVLTLESVGNSVIIQAGTDIRLKDDVLFFDNKKFWIGTSKNYWFEYNTSGSRLRFWTSNGDGESTDMVFMRVLDGTITPQFPGAIQVDTIDEFTSAAGITIDGVLIKDGAINMTGDLTNAVNINMTGDLTSDGDLLSVNIETSANIGAGKESPNFRIDAYINRTAGIVRSGRFQVDGNHVDARGLYIIAGEDTESGTNYWLEAYDGDGGINTGGLRSVAGVFDVYDACDKKLKQDIINTQIIGRDIILGLKVRDFKWKKNPEHKVTGLIAQEVLKIYPDAVGKPDRETGMYGLSRSILIPLLIKHNQELQNEIDSFEKRLTKLERSENEQK